jgi:hypothetical protein
MRCKLYRSDKGVRRKQRRSRDATTTTTAFRNTEAPSFKVSAYESAHPDLIGKYSSNGAFPAACINTYKTTGTFLT